MKSLAILLLTASVLLAQQTTGDITVTGVIKIADNDAFIQLPAEIAVQGARASKLRILSKESFSSFKEQVVELRGFPAKGNREKDHADITLTVARTPLVSAPVVVPVINNTAESVPTTQNFLVIGSWEPVNIDSHDTIDNSRSHRDGDTTTITHNWGTAGGGGGESETVTPKKLVGTWEGKLVGENFGTTVGLGAGGFGVGAALPTEGAAGIKLEFRKDGSGAATISNKSRFFGISAQDIAKGSGDPALIKSAETQVCDFKWTLKDNVITLVGEGDIPILEFHQNSMKLSFPLPPGDERGTAELIRTK